MSTYYIAVILQRISIIVLAAGTIYLFYKWKGREHSYLLIFCMATMINNIGALAEIMARNSEEAMLANKFAYIGKVFIPLTFFFFVLQYCHIYLSPKIKLLMTFFHMFIAVLVFSFPAHKLFYTSITYVETGMFPHNVFGHGVMYNVYTLCLVIYFIAIICVLVHSLKKEKVKKRRMPMFYLFACAICAILGLVIFLTGITNGYDTTSLSYMICTILIAIALAKYNMLETVELVRNYVIDNISLGITALDEHDRIVYYNSLFKNIFPDCEKNEQKIARELIDSCENKDIVLGDCETQFIN